MHFMEKKIKEIRELIDSDLYALEKEIQFKFKLSWKETVKIFNDSIKDMFKEK